MRPSLRCIVGGGFGGAMEGDSGHRPPNRAESLPPAAPRFVRQRGRSDESLGFQSGTARQGAAVLLQEKGAFADALELLQRATTIDPSYAEMQFRIGQCHLALGNEGEAKEAF